LTTYKFQGQRTIFAYRRGNSSPGHELIAHLIAAPALNWPEAAGKASYLLNLFAATLFLLLR
jgi:hypothetical protein